jgi:hypothetical protein
MKLFEDEGGGLLAPYMLKFTPCIIRGELLGSPKPIKFEFCIVGSPDMLERGFMVPRPLIPGRPKCPRLKLAVSEGLDIKPN